ncbi:MAG: GNAT family N-acetyltransferase [Armatimonadetes bacterium]|nr:GNAT family N-acetyltransferase [Armatimonadota bacterium]
MSERGEGDSRLKDGSSMGRDVRKYRREVRGERRNGMHESEIIDRFTLPLEVIIRVCRREDLPALEWYGLMTEYRGIIQETFEMQERGEAVMLVAEVNGFPAGQVWINLVLKKDEAMGALWAVRVFPFLQGRKVGSRLMEAAEQLLRNRGYRAVELGVEKDNPDARRFYERLGYRESGTAQGGFTYTTPDGEEITMPLDEWIMRKQL